ncbi:MAG TPA: hypothetical protein VHZ52_09905 [Acidobacteriaceae bacterium]|jgi:hypothetical protein|nr:hypothetical protein [Acidobacteriaceae bacterium]
MLPSQFKRLIESFRAHGVLIQEALNEQGRATRDAAEAADEKWREVPGIIASNILGTAKDKESAEAYHQKSEGQQESLVKSQNKLVFWTRLAFIAAGIYAAIAGVQACEMRESTKATQQAVGIATITLGETIRNDTAQEVLNTNTLDATLKNFRNDQRPWVSLQPPPCDHCKLEMGVFYANSVTGVISNTGKTPAEDVKVDFSIKYGGYYWVEDDCRLNIRNIKCIVGVTKIQKFRSQTEWHAPLIVGVVPPNQTAPITFWADNYTYPDQPDGISGVVYIEGEITYRMPWGGNGITRFCYPLRDVYFMQKSNTEDYCQERDRNIMR